jgi:hypothetical protein
MVRLQLWVREVYHRRMIGRHWTSGQTIDHPIHRPPEKKQANIEPLRKMQEHMSLKSLSLLFEAIRGSFIHIIYQTSVEHGD